MTHISKVSYSEIVTLMPILCVDIIVNYDNEYILLKRNQNPLKGIWWPPGGRVLIGEKLEAAAKRKLREELNITDAEGLKLIGLYEDFFEQSEFSNHQYHTVSAVFSLKISQTSNLETDDTSECWGAIESLPERLVKNLSYLLHD